MVGCPTCRKSVYFLRSIFNIIIFASFFSIFFNYFATPVDLESDDSLSLSGNQVRLVASTGQNLDGFTFQTDPGAAIELDALLDDGPANRFLFWAGDGALRSGAPSNPIDLVPSAD